jgi:thiosulfate dehydrogenase [quinone] large subunit
MASNFIVESWRSNNLATKILRAWLGLTWFYAGWQKASDVGFLDKASPNYLGTQLAGFAHGSPLKFFLERAVHVAQPLGWAIMFAEFAIGVAVLTGYFLELAIIGGALVSFGLWLAVTWNVYPFFLGSDTAYMAMWIVLYFAVRAQNKHQAKARIIPNLGERRTFLQAAAVAIASLISIGAGGAFKKAVPTTAKGKEIVKLSAFPVGANLQFTASDGNPAFLFRTTQGVYAYSAVCTHQGCVVMYTAQTKTLDCPCHGGQYDPFGDGKVIAGPPPSPLPKYSVTISGNSIIEG